MDNAEDAAGLLDPNMPPAMARGIVKGLIDASGNTGTGYPPVRPWNVQASTLAGGIRVTWARGIDPDDTEASAEDSFVVKASTGNGTWKNVALVPSGTTQIDLTTTDHGTLSIKVAARNAAGESLDSEVYSITY